MHLGVVDDAMKYEKCSYKLPNVIDDPYTFIARASATTSNSISNCNFPIDVDCFK